MGIQDKNTKNSIKSKNYLKSKIRRLLKESTLTDWYIVIKPSVPCSGRKRTSEKMSVDSVQDLSSQLALKVGLVRLIIVVVSHTTILFERFYSVTTG